MIIAFVTFGGFKANATLKRATGMAEPLMKRGHRVILLLQVDAANRERVAHECPNVEVIWHDELKSPFKERAVKQSTLNQLNPDIVWICGPGLRNWMARPSSTSVLVADYSERYMHITDGKILRTVWEYALEWMYPFVFDGHICASRYLEFFFKQRSTYLPGRTPVLYFPYAFSSDAAESDTISTRLSIQKTKSRVFLYLGSFWENYGFWDMLEAFKQLRGQRNDFLFLMLGKGPELERGQQWLIDKKLDDCVKIVGFVSDKELPAYLELADAFLCPLRNTPQDIARCPSKLFLYIPYKKPIVTCRIGEAAELLEDSAAYYKAEDVNDMVNRLVEICDNDYIQHSFINPTKHTWCQRTEEFLLWFEENFKPEAIRPIV